MKVTAVGHKDIVTALRNDGAFNVLVKCIRATDRLKILQEGGGEFTLFAPCEHAFKRLSDQGERSGRYSRGHRMQQRHHS